MRDLAVISPHLDDAVLSLGATITRATRRGTAVRVVTVFAGDPLSQAPADEWDALCGYRTAGAAAAARRVEDDAACDVVRARPVWLPYATGAAVRGHEHEVVDAIRAALDDAMTVLVPGFPLTHPDHRLCTAMALDACPSIARIGLYVEQPYAVWEVVGSRSAVARHAVRLAQAARFGVARARQSPVSPLEPDPAKPFLCWDALESAPEDRATKRRATRAYTSQIAGLGRAIISQIALYERSWGGEGVAWLAPGQRAAFASLSTLGR
jgi:LmbE family N-acetylglucosaminyl deacetylase